MRRLLILLLLLAQSDPVAETLRKIDEEPLRAHEKYLASDELEGRAAGFPGNEKAVEYLVKEAKAYGLKAAGEEGGFTQEFTFRNERKARNVIALLEGADPRLREEYVAIGAHLDHVGKLGQDVRGQLGGAKDGDEIWNGADDNASGASAVLVVSRAFAAGAVRPRRSILFLWWNAEEAGLLGSRHWARHPTRPVEKVVYYLNLDMVGRNPERPMDVEGVKNAEGEALEKIMTAACEAEKLRITKYDHRNEAMFRSDGASLLREGVPASMFFTYWHEDYHRVTDHADKIAYDNLARISRVAFRILVEVANRDEPLRLNLDTPLGGKPLRIRADDVAMGEAGGCRVTSVEEESFLGRAGLKARDVVVRVGGRPLPAVRPRVEFWKRVQAARAEDELEIEIVRDGEKAVLKAAWGRK